MWYHAVKTHKIRHTINNIWCEFHLDSYHELVKQVVYENIASPHAKNSFPVYDIMFWFRGKVYEVC